MRDDYLELLTPIIEIWNIWVPAKQVSTREIQVNKGNILWFSSSYLVNIYIFKIIWLNSNF